MNAYFLVENKKRCRTVIRQLPTQASKSRCLLKQKKMVNQQEIRNLINFVYESLEFSFSQLLFLTQISMNTSIFFAYLAWQRLFLSFLWNFVRESAAQPAKIGSPCACVTFDCYVGCPCKAWDNWHILRMTALKNLKTTFFKPWHNLM